MNAESDDIAAAKHAARVRARAARSALERARCELASRSACERALGLRELACARLVLCYAAMPEELDPSHLAKVLRDRGVAVAYPRIEAPGVLGVHVVGDESSLVSGMFGIREPAEDAPRVEPRAIDAAIVPGVAFDEQCWRLGYGGGYYDRLLPLLRPDAARIGLAYDEQVLVTIPAEEHDVRLDAVVTPTRVVRASVSG